MSIFGSLGGLVGNLLNQYGGAEGVASQVLNQMGGVQGVLDKLQQSGLGGQVSSWLGKGPNEPISPQDVTNALGHGPVADVAAKLGIPPEQLSQVMAQVLPGLVDRLSPNGHVQPHLLDGGAADGTSPAAPPS